MMELRVDKQREKRTIAISMDSRLDWLRWLGRVSATLPLKNISHHSKVVRKNIVEEHQPRISLGNKNIFSLRFCGNLKRHSPHRAAFVKNGEMGHVFAFLLWRLGSWFESKGNSKPKGHRGCSVHLFCRCGQKYLFFYYSFGQVWRVLWPEVSPARTLHTSLM